MNALILLLWFGNVFFDTLGQVAFKYAATAPSREGFRYWIDLFKNYWLWIGILSYVAEFLLWLAFLSLVPLSQGILLGCVNIITVMLVGRWLFKEYLVPFRVIGILCIAFGIILVGFSGLEAL